MFVVFRDGDRQAGRGRAAWCHAGVDSSDTATALYGTSAGNHNRQQLLFADGESTAKPQWGKSG